MEWIIRTCFSVQVTPVSPHKSCLWEEGGKGLLWWRVPRNASLEAWGGGNRRRWHPGRQLWFLSIKSLNGSICGKFISAVKPSTSRTLIEFIVYYFDLFPSFNTLEKLQDFWKSLCFNLFNPSLIFFSIILMKMISNKTKQCNTDYSSQKVKKWHNSVRNLQNSGQVDIASTEIKVLLYCIFTYTKRKSKEIILEKDNFYIYLQ